jgi:hypothetical protein
MIIPIVKLALLRFGLFLFTPSPGNHSPGHVAKLKPAIEDLMRKENLTAHLDPHNPGVLVVQLQQQGGGKGSREVLDDMDKNPDICAIM